MPTILSICFICNRYLTNVSIFKTNRLLIEFLILTIGNHYLPIRKIKNLTIINRRKINAIQKRFGTYPNTEDYFNERSIPHITILRFISIAHFSKDDNEEDTGC